MDSSFSSTHSGDYESDISVDPLDATLDPYGADPRPSADDIVRATAAAAATAAFQDQDVQAQAQDLKPWQRPYRKMTTF